MQKTFDVVEEFQHLASERGFAIMLDLGRQLTIEKLKAFYDALDQAAISDEKSLLVALTAKIVEGIGEGNSKTLKSRIEILQQTKLLSDADFLIG